MLSPTKERDDARKQLLNIVGGTSLEIADIVTISHLIAVISTASELIGTETAFGRIEKVIGG